MTGVEILQESDVPELDTALESLSELPLVRAYRLPPERIRRWIRGTLVGSLDDPGSGRTLFVKGDDGILAATIVEKRPWESEVFGLDMGRIPLILIWDRIGDDPDLAPAVAEGVVGGIREVFDEWGIQHGSVLVDAGYTPILHGLEATGWRLMDSTLEFAWACGRTTAPEASSRLEVRPFREEDRAPLTELARTTYRNELRTRYGTDDSLSQAHVGKLYARWFELACEGTFGDIVAVAEVDGRPAGFNTLKREASLSEATNVGFAAHGISAVDTGYRGMGIQPAMLHWLAEWQRRQGGGFTRGRVLVNNHPMQRACLKSGAFIAHAYHTFHLRRRTARDHGAG